MRKITAKKLPKPYSVPSSLIAAHYIYPYLLDFVEYFGFPPTLQQIGDAFNRTKQWAHLATRELLRQKLVIKVKGQRKYVPVRKEEENGQV